MNKKIPSVLAIGIILIIAVVVGGIFWIGNKKENKLNQIPIPAISQTENPVAINQGKVQVPERISGIGCYAKDANGDNDEYQFRQDFNTSASTTTVKYSNTEKEISFDIPFNQNWGNKDCTVKPYTEFKQASGDILVEFGKPRAWVTSEFSLTISKQRPAEDIIAEQKNVGGEPNPNPIKKIIGDKTMVVYESYGMGVERIYEVIGKNYNYSFSYSEIDKLNDSSIKSLENIIENIKFITDKLVQKPPIVEIFACSDYCPGPPEKHMKKVYQGIEDEEECRKLGGTPSSFTGWGTFKICLAE